MKRLYFTLFFTLTFSTILFSQKGTIKIAKPIPTNTESTKKDTFQKPQILTLIAELGPNYSFKGNNKVGYSAGLTFKPNVYNLGYHAIFIGIQYTLENQYYQISAFNFHTSKAEKNYDKSENKSEYLKLPILFNANMNVGAKSDIRFSLGLTPSFLLKNQDQYERLKYQDFNQYNLSGNILLGVELLRNFYLCLSYSKNFFENLKDINIYNSMGEPIGKQNSKTKLLSLSLTYTINRRLR